MDSAGRQKVEPAAEINGFESLLKGRGRHDGEFKWRKMFRGMTGHGKDVFRVKWMVVRTK